MTRLIVALVANPNWLWKSPLFWREGKDFDEHTAVLGRSCIKTLQDCSAICAFRLACWNKRKSQGGDFLQSSAALVPVSQSFYFARVSSGNEDAITVYMVTLMLLYVLRSQT